MTAADAGLGDVGGNAASRAEHVLSIVIPTRDRRHSLMRLLRSLEHQTVPPGTFDVIVVNDGGIDDTTDVLRHYQGPFEVRILQGRGHGPAAARNLGARSAFHLLLLFLDDDVEAHPRLVAEHLDAHDSRAEQAVVGAYFPSHRPTRDPFRILTRNWWEETFAEMGRPGHRTSYRDLLSGNLSVRRDAFLDWGEFDEGFRGVRCEDWELGARLLRRGVPIVFRPEAAATHHEADTLSLSRALRDARKEGRGFARLDRLHPEVAGERSEGGPLVDGRVKRLVRRVACRGGLAGDLFMGGLRLLLGPLGALKLRQSWRHLYGLLHLHAFWRGYHEPLDGTVAPVQLDTPRAEETSLDLEIADGWANGIDALDRLRPSSVRIRWRGRPIGTIEPATGAERLRGAHLPSLLANELAAPLQQALLDESLRHHSGA